jgi:hypothetical protein
LSFAEFEGGLIDAGLTDVSITPTHSVVPGMYSAIIRATKPPRDPDPRSGPPADAALPVPAGS